MANVLDFAAELGRALYRCGAETYRIEDTVRRVILSLTEANTEVDVFAIPAYLTISVRLPTAEGGARSDTTDETEELEVEAVEGHVLHRSMRMSGISYNLASLEKINELSRLIVGKKVNLEQAFAELRTITKDAETEVVWWRMPLAYGSVGAGFALMLGAQATALPLAFLIGFCLHFIISPLEEREFNRSLINAFGAFFVTFLTWGLFHLGWLGNAADYVNIGVLMTLVPGMLLTNGARDLMAGDTVSGLSNLTEALLAALALGLGSGLALYFWQIFF